MFSPVPLKGSACTRDIRRSIVQDKSLSTYAYNVKIISLNGMVTLKGPGARKRKRRHSNLRGLRLLARTK
jgi:hypothetical protein